jgi:hypothetical protein
MITDFPKSDKFGVTPRDKPAVLNAENASNASLSNPCLESLIESNKTESPRTNKDNKIMAKARLMDALEISLRKASVF